MSAELTCGGKALKCLVFFFNLLAFMAGVAMLGGCLAARFMNPVTEYVMANEEVRDIVKDNVSHFHILLYAGMFIGGILCILGFLGCCGAWMENVCMLSTFAAILILLLLAQIVIGALVFANKGKGDKVIGSAVDKLIALAGGTDTSKKKAACLIFDKMHSPLSCCGRGNEGELQKCQDDLNLAKCDPAYNTVSCATKIIDKFDQYGMIVGIVAIVFVAFEVAAVIFAICLCCAIKKGHMESSFDD